MRMKFYSLAAAVLSATVLGAAPEVKVLQHQVVNDTVTDAVSPSGLAVTRNGDYLATFADRGDVSPGCRSYLVRSTDGGKSWSAPEQTFASKDEREGVSLIMCNLPDGDILLGVNHILHDGTDRKAVGKPRTSRNELFRSADGKNFTPIALLDTPEGSMFSEMGAVLELSNGDWILPSYGYPKRKNIPGAVYGSGFFRSSDKGKTWGKFERAFRDEPPAGEKPYNFNESAFFIRPDGTLTALARIDSRPVCNLWRVESTDNGKSWSVPVETDIPGIYPAVLPLADGGFLLVCGNRNARPIPRTINFYYSQDGNKFESIGKPFYTRTGGLPRNSATGGAQCVIAGPEKGQALVLFYAHDPALQGYHQTYVDSNIIQVIK